MTTAPEDEAKAVVKGTMAELFPEDHTEPMGEYVWSDQCDPTTWIRDYTKDQCKFMRNDDDD